jgi:hypothetical protein
MIDLNFIEKMRATHAKDSAVMILCDMLLREHEHRQRDMRSLEMRYWRVEQAFHLANADAGARAKHFREERNKWRSLARLYAKDYKARGLPTPERKRP